MQKNRYSSRVVRDVKLGRGELNFSDWNSLKTRDKIKLLDEIAEEVKEEKAEPKKKAPAKPKAAAKKTTKKDEKADEEKAE